MYSSEILTAKLLPPSLKLSATRQEPGGCPGCHGHWAEGFIFPSGSPLLDAEKPDVTPELLLTKALTHCTKLVLSPCTSGVAFRGGRGRPDGFNRHAVPGSGLILPVTSHRILLVSGPLRTEGELRVWGSAAQCQPHPIAPCAHFCRLLMEKRADDSRDRGHHRWNISDCHFALYHRRPLLL